MTEHLDKDISEGIFPKSLVISHTIWAQDSWLNQRISCPHRVSCSCAQEQPQFTGICESFSL
jgi:hypothetical protein